MQIRLPARVISAAAGNVAHRLPLSLVDQLEESQVPLHENNSNNIRATIPAILPTLSQNVAFQFQARQVSENQNYFPQYQ